MYLKAVNDSGEMIGWAACELPVEAETKQHGSGGIRVESPLGAGRQFVRVVCRALEAMREHVLKGRKCFGKSICYVFTYRADCISAQSNSN